MQSSSLCLTEIRTRKGYNLLSYSVCRLILKTYNPGIDGKQSVIAAFHGKAISFGFGTQEASANLFYCVRKLIFHV